MNTHDIAKPTAWGHDEEQAKKNQEDEDPFITKIWKKGRGKFKHKKYQDWHSHSIQQDR